MASGSSDNTLLKAYENIKFSEKDKIELNAGYLLRRAFKRARKHMLNRIEEHNMTPMQTAAIHALVENGPTSQNKLGRYIGMEPGNVHGLVERLSKKNLITSRRDEQDARHYVLELTDLGIKTAAEIIPLRFKASEDVLSPLTEKERKRFLELLLKLT
ncbi:MAG: winged helix-turn-helix transcriptional regulator [Kordiimonadaceae bacterium]|jgi:MarR family transcriptional regulator, lower aerobic nicotinate degradation pathway regulator|nr:winged helix-turn-helix transcriptional regulator [Kordiimonadaceae bacterium]MBT6032480.1 winged helix-turn-helix transcriptional regulator [Kordiimonadaceae bacterium]